MKSNVRYEIYCLESVYTREIGTVPFGTYPKLARIGLVLTREPVAWWHRGQGGAMAPSEVTFKGRQITKMKISIEN